MCVQKKKSGRNRRFGDRIGCQYFEWHDEPFDAQATKVIKELLEENGNLKFENAKLKSFGGDRKKQEEFSELELEFTQLKREIKNSREVGQNYKWKMWFSVVIINWCLLFVVMIVVLSK